MLGIDGHCVSCKGGLVQTSTRRRISSHPCRPSLTSTCQSNTQQIFQRHCPMSMPVEAGTPTGSPGNPLPGVYISLDTRVMTEMAIEMENTAGVIRKPTGGPLPQGIAPPRRDNAFSGALLRLLQLGDNPADTAVPGDSRLRGSKSLWFSRV